MKHMSGVITSAITAFLGGVLFLATTAPALAQSVQRVSPKIQKEFHFDMHHNVGKPLPSGIKVTDSHGHSVDLHALLQSLHAPVMLLIVRPKNCPPCDMLLAYVRKHPDLNAHGKTARLVVLRIMDPGHASLKLPANMIELHTPHWFHSGFLAHYSVPETFVFNRKLTLIERKIGLTLPEATLTYPKATSKNQVTTYQKN